MAGLARAREFAGRRGLATWRHPCGARKAPLVVGPVLVQSMVQAALPDTKEAKAGLHL